MCVWYDPNTTTAEEAMRITDNCTVSIEDAEFYDQNGKLYNEKEVFKKIEEKWKWNE